MSEETPAAAPATRPPAEEKAAAKLQADSLAEIEKAQAEQRKILDEHEAAAYTRAHGPAIPTEE